MADPMTSRGYRNRNPGNLNYIADPKRAWNGQAGLGDAWLPQAQRRFAEYESHEMGIRAIVGQLVVNQTRYGLTTIRKQITRWAPPTDGNLTEVYVAAVAHRVGIERDAPLDVRRYSHAKPMVQAIINHECGGMPYSDAQIDAGLALYGLTPHSERQVATIGQAATTQTGQGAITVAGIGAAAAAIAPALQAVSSAPQWTGVAVVVAGLVLALVVVLRGRRDA